MSDLLLRPGSPHYTPCTTPHRPMDLGTFRADGRALQIDTDIVLALPFQNSYDFAVMDLSHATIEEFAADGFTHGICACSPGASERCGGSTVSSLICGEV